MRNPFDRKVTKKYNDPENENEIVVTYKDETPNGQRLVIAFFFLVLGAATVGQQLYFQGQRNAEVKAQQKIDDQFRTDQEDTNTRLQDEIDTATSERDALKALFLAILNAKSPAESRKLIQDFIANDNRKRATPSPTPSASRSSFRPSPQPAPRPSPSARSPTPKPTHKPTPKPSPTCIIPTPVPQIHCPVIDADDQVDT